MTDIDYNYLFDLFLLTGFIYILPMALVRINGPRSKKTAHNFALGNSIIIALVFMIMRMSNGISDGSFGLPILYYFINKSILRFGYKGEDSTSTKGAGVFTIKDNIEDIESSFKDDFDYKKLYQSYDNDIKKLVFQGGFDDFLSVLQSMRNLLGNEYSFKELIKIYVDVWMGLEGNEPKEVVNLLKSQNAYKHISEKSEIITSFVVNHKKDKSYKIIVDELDTLSERQSEKNGSIEGTMDENYRSLYESLNPKLKSFIFPAGYNEFIIIINSLKYLFEKKYSAIELVKMYAVNWTRTGQSDADEVVKRIKLSNDLKDDQDKIDLLVSFILIHKNNTDFEIKDMESFNFTKKFAESFKDRVKYKEINTHKITENIYDEDYGRVAHKPIYIDGFKGSDRFLKSLKSSNGDSLICKRKGSIPGEGGSVDIYEVENENTHEREILYVNLYSENSNYYLPKGYSMVSTDDVHGNFERSSNESNSESQNVQKDYDSNEYNEVKLQDKNEVKDKTCIKCNHKNSIESKYCANCGSELLSKMYCKKCGSKIKESSNFCHLCGTRV